MLRCFFALLLLALVTPASVAAPGNAFADGLGLVPLPARIVEQEGRFQPGRQVTIALSGMERADADALGPLARDILSEAWKRPVALQPDKRGAATLTLTLQADTAANPESYRLEVTPAGIALRAPTGTGLFYGLQTLRQLATAGSQSSAGIPALLIEDAPRFGYRGLHLDVARHMYPVDAIKQHLELMARYKFNTFHWHLTDDQGWRLEIKRFPRLTEVGATRKKSLKGRYDPDTFVGDGTPYGGFYTQAQAREIVEYARQRHITVIPEIDMPGHMVAALAAYPQLACTPGPFEVRKTWGISDDILCPSEETFQFVEGVLTEVMDIFPARQVHLGGDEAPTIRWEQSPLAQEIIKREGLKDEHALQGWFMRRVVKFLGEHGRTMIGWDEILDGDPDPNATVMAWRGVDKGIEAAKRGYNVIMSPTEYFYLDYCQGPAEQEPVCPGSNTLLEAYSFNPVPDDLTPEQAQRILGTQGNLWTEYVKDTAQMQYMFWPRAFAVSEVAWSPQATRDWNSFVVRLQPHFDTLQAMGVGYRIPEVSGLEQDRTLPEARTRITLLSPVRGASIVYTVDGSEPGATSQRYAQPFDVALSPEETRISARLLLADGRLGPVATANYMQGTPATTPAPPPSR